MRPKLNADRTVVMTKEGFIPWDAENNRPFDHEGEAGRIVAEALAEYGMTEPDPETT